ncbi:MAG: DNA topoisomerase I, partial [Euryarchaeota archaeon]|nr:DNA topoisomerase I [Euryarchaeota archaeon]
MRRLVIAEKGSAALRLAVVLSKGTFKRRRVGVTTFEFERDGVAHTVLGLRGHLVGLDYPPEFHVWKREDLDALLAATPVETIGEPAIGDALRGLAADADEAWVCTDYDREGELIGSEALRIAREGKPDLPARRARFSALTAWEIEDAFRNPVEVDERLADAARARGAVDLVWGAVLTRFLSLACDLRGHEFLSVGRVQTPTLGLLVEREREIEEFVPQPYWRIAAALASEPPATASHATERFLRQDEAEAAQARAALADQGLVVDARREEVEGRRPPPFNTTSFLAEATRLGFGAARAMAVAEGLYRSGYISYPRTDNTVYPQSLNLRAALERLRDSEFGEQVSAVLAQETIRPSRGPVQATDHPPIYPTQPAPKNKLRPDHWKVYELVVRRFLATLAPSSRELAAELRLEIGGEPFVARGRTLLDPGWRAYYGPAFAAAELPQASVGDWIPVAAVTLEPGETEPPPRYTQGHLIQEMEAHGLGTKSTRHDIVQKLYDRGYVEGRRIRVTAAGRAVVEALEAFGGQVARPDMTARLEREMDAIASGARTADDVVAVSRALLAAVLA